LRRHALIYQKLGRRGGLTVEAWVFAWMHDSDSAGCCARLPGLQGKALLVN
jgi:hypothetical protein